MNKPTAISGSFRDPNGMVYRHNNQIFRTISDNAMPAFLNAVETGLLGSLIEAEKLVGWQDASSVTPDLMALDGVAQVIEHPKLDFISYPYEWSFGALKAAALAHLDIQLEALEFDIVLSDATAFNIQFQGPNPLFIDHLSFQPYESGMYWLGHRQFCEQFLTPLLLRSRLGIPHNAWLRGDPEGIPLKHIAAMLPWSDKLKPSLLVNVFLPTWFEGKKTTNAKVASSVKKRALPKVSYRGMLKSLRKSVAAQTIPDVTSVWSDYAANTSYSSEETEEKRKMIGEFCTKIKPDVLWDIGCNTGEYSKIALANGAKLSIGFEFDSGALEKAYARAVSEELNFLPLYTDAANPSPSQGWNQNERDGFLERRNADGLLALAVIHHLCIGRKIPLSNVVRWLVDLSPSGIIEFVPKTDPMVIELLSLREDIFDSYTDANFNQEISKYARIVQDKIITKEGRRLVWYERL